MMSCPRWGFPVLTMLLIVLFAASALLGITSYRWPIRLEWGHDQHYRMVGVGAGSFWFQFGGTTHDAIEYGEANGLRIEQTDDVPIRRASARQNANHDWRALGLEWISWIPDSDAGGWEYGIVFYLPAWMASLAALGLGARLVLRDRRLRRLRAGLCEVCGYDLRATPRRCPECGTRRETQQDPRCTREASIR
jgi:hypothetical protein